MDSRKYRRLRRGKVTANPASPGLKLNGHFGHHSSPVPAGAALVITCIVLLSGAHAVSSSSLAAPRISESYLVSLTQEKIAIPEKKPVEPLMSEPRFTPKGPRTHQSPDEPSNEPPPEVFGVDRNTVAEGGGQPVPVGNTLMKEPDAEYTSPEKVQNIYNPAEVDTAPRYRSVIKPEYPRAARVQGIQGIVKISVVVDEKGYPTQLKIVQGIGYGCDEAALYAVGKYRFSPGIINGRPGKVEVIVPVQFQLSQ